MNRPQRLPRREVRRRARIHSIIVTVLFGLFWVPVIIFAGLAGEVIERTPLGFDTALLSFADSIHSPVLTNIFLFITSFGQPIVLGGAGLAALAILLVRRDYRGGALLLLGLGGAVAANLLLKSDFARSRPADLDRIISEPSYSFPSGHAMVSAAFGLTLVILVWRTRLRWPVAVLAALATLLIGTSRVYLEVHYASDVIAGWCVGVVWAVAAGSLVLDRPFRLGRLMHRLFGHDEGRAIR